MKVSPALFKESKDDALIVPGAGFVGKNSKLFVVECNKAHSLINNYNELLSTLQVEQCESYAENLSKNIKEMLVIEVGLMQIYGSVIKEADVAKILIVVMNVAKERDKLRAALFVGDEKKDEKSEKASMPAPKFVLEKNLNALAAASTSGNPHRAKLEVAKMKGMFQAIDCIDEQLQHWLQEQMKKDVAVVPVSVNR